MLTLCVRRQLELIGLSVSLSPADGLAQLPAGLWTALVDWLFTHRQHSMLHSAFLRLALLAILAPSPPALSALLDGARLVPRLIAAVTAGDASGAFLPGRPPARTSIAH